jgi:hypothetical protein
MYGATRDFLDDQARSTRHIILLGAETHELQPWEEAPLGDCSKLGRVFEMPH